MKLKAIGYTLFILFSTFIARTSVAEATEAAAQSSGPQLVEVFVFHPDATLTLEAYSEVDNQKNLEKTDPEVNDFILIVEKDKETGKIKTVERYFPPIGIEALKPKPKADRNVESKTKVLAEARGTAVYDIRDDFPPIRLRTEAVFVPSGPLRPGRAAAKAIDPFPVSPGEYEYTAIIDEIDLLLDIPEVPEFAGVNFFAMDSRFEDPLWLLSVILDERNPDSIVNVSFLSNSVLGLDDSTIEKNVLSALNVTSTPTSISATLTDFILFETTYSVDSEIQYEEGNTAGVLVTPVPEPTSTLSLLALGTLGAASTLKRKLKSSKSTEKETTEVS